MSNAFKHEITNYELWQEVDGLGVAIRALFNCLIEELRVQKHQDDIAGLVKYPTRICVRWQNGEMPGHPTPAHLPAMQRPLQLHIGSIINAECRNPQCRQGDIDIAQ